MDAIKTILRYEWLQLKRSKAFWLLTIIFCCISLYAAWYGNNEVKQQQRKIELVKYSIDTSMNTLHQQLLKHDSVAWEYEPLYKAIIYNKPDGLAALAFGQRDLHKFAIEISEGTYYYNKYATGYTNKTLSGEINNPQKQLAGHLDISFVIIFLLPLYFILLSYNLLSSEREQGTLSMLGIQPISIRQIFYSKLFVRWLVTFSLAIGMILLASVITGALADNRLWLIILATLLYSLFWAGIVTIITALHKPSGFNALILISSWLLICVLLPATFNSVLKAKYPTANKIKLTTAVQKANTEVFAMPRMDVADSFYKLNKAYKNKPGDTLPNGWYNPRWMRSVHAVLDYGVEPVEKEYQQLLS
ncbi:MAG: ABC transporter permease, partial [Ferruginibacter sp.]